MKPIQVGLLGIGTVGGGVFSVLDRNQEEITRRAGRGIKIHTVADLDTKRAEELVKGRAKVVSDAKQVVNDPEIDVVVELIGGYGIAKELVLAAINNGKHVVTANKALLAVHGNEIFAAAQAKGVTVNTVSPGYIGTEMVRAIRPDVLEKIVGTVPVKRLGEPSEIASIVSWLASQESGYSTGADFSVNGGLHIG